MVDDHDNDSYNLLQDVLDLARASLDPSSLGRIETGLKDKREAITLDLGWNNLGGQGVVHVAKLVQRQPNRLKTIDLWSNGVDNEGARGLAKLVRNNNTLTCVNLRGNKIDEDGALSLLKAIRGNKTSSMQQLDLVRNPIGVENEAIASIFSKPLGLKDLEPTSLDALIDLLGADSVDHADSFSSPTPLAAPIDVPPLSNSSRSEWLDGIPQAYIVRTDSASWGSHFACETATSYVHLGSLQVGESDTEPIAVKVLKTSVSEQEASRMAKAYCRLDSQHNPRLLGFCQRGSERCIISHWIGASLDDLYNTTSPQHHKLLKNLTPLYRRARVCVDVAKAIRTLHMHNKLIHCKLTPTSILVDSNRRAKVCGLRHVVLAGESPPSSKFSLHTAPELATFGRCSPASDVYSLGVLCHELLTLTSTNSLPPKDTLSSSMFPKLDCPANLTSLLCRCLSEQPSERPTIEIMHTALNTWTKQIMNGIAESLQAADPNDSLGVTSNGTPLRPFRNFYGSDFGDMEHSEFDENDDQMSCVGSTRSVVSTDINRKISMALPLGSITPSVSRRGSPEYYNAEPCSVRSLRTNSFPLDPRSSTDSRKSSDTRRINRELKHIDDVLVNHQKQLNQANVAVTKVTQLEAYISQLENKMKILMALQSKHNLQELETNAGGGEEDVESGCPTSLEQVSSLHNLPPRIIPPESLSNESSISTTMLDSNLSNKIASDEPITFLELAPDEEKIVNTARQKEIELEETIKSIVQQSMQSVQEGINTKFKIFQNLTFSKFAEVNMKQQDLEAQMCELMHKLGVDMTKGSTSRQDEKPIGLEARLEAKLSEVKVHLISLENEMKTSYTKVETEIQTLNSDMEKKMASSFTSSDSLRMEARKRLASSSSSHSHLDSRATTLNVPSEEPTRSSTMTDRHRLVGSRLQQTRRKSDDLATHRSEPVKKKSTPRPITDRTLRRASAEEGRSEGRVKGRGPSTNESGSRDLANPPKVLKEAPPYESVKASKITRENEPKSLDKVVRDDSGTSLASLDTSMSSSADTTLMVPSLPGMVSPTIIPASSPSKKSSMGSHSTLTRPSTIYKSVFGPIVAKRKPSSTMLGKARMPEDLGAMPCSPSAVPSEHSNPSPRSGVSYIGEMGRNMSSRLPSLFSDRQNAPGKTSKVTPVTSHRSRPATAETAASAASRRRSNHKAAEGERRVPSHGPAARHGADYLTTTKKRSLGKVAASRGVT